MNLPNFLTISRVFIAFLFLYFVFFNAGQYIWLAFIFFILASVTDYWDGKLARMRGEITFFGKIMDPIADKVLTISAFGSFYYLGLLPLYLVLIVVCREALVTWQRLLMLSRGQEPSESRGSGKQKTFFQIIYISMVLVYLFLRQKIVWPDDVENAWRFFIYWGMVGILILTLWSGFKVIKSNLRYLKAIVSFGFLGCLPWPGAWGSLAGMMLCWIIPSEKLPLIFLIMTFVSAALCKPVVKCSGLKDPQWFVLDEVCGMMLSVLWVPKEIVFYAAGYILFRIFDVLKPGPIRTIEKGTGDTGIVWDDIAAGAVTALLMAIYFTVVPGAAS